MHCAPSTICVISIGFAVFSSVETRLNLRANDAGFFIFRSLMFVKCFHSVRILGALVKGFNKKYHNLFYDSGLEAVVAKAGHVCGGVVNRARFRAGGLRGPGAVLK